MLTLPDAIRMLRNEIAEALASRQPHAPTVQFTANRATVTLRLDLHDDSNSTGPTRFVVSGNGQAPHQVTIEFTLPPSDSPQSNGHALHAIHGTAPNPQPEPDLETLATALAGIFGSPGFDSSARATVFRECLTELGPEEAQSLVSTLGATPPPGESTAALKARNRIRRLASLVSTEPDRALRTGAHCAGAYPVATILELATTRWKTQADWITH